METTDTKKNRKNFPFGHVWQIAPFFEVLGILQEKRREGEGYPFEIFNF